MGGGAGHAHSHMDPEAHQSVCPSPGAQAATALPAHRPQVQKHGLRPQILNPKASSFTSKRFEAPSSVLQATKRSQMIKGNSSHVTHQPCPLSGNKGRRWQIKLKARFLCGFLQNMTSPIALLKPEMLLLSEMASGCSQGFISLSFDGYPQQEDWKEAKSKS